MSQEEDPIIGEFVVESREHLADVENQLLTMEAAGASVDMDLVNTVFRAVHSIKGAAGFLGFVALGELSHSLENVLNLVRNRELVPDSTNVDAMLRAADTLRSMVDNIGASNDVDVSAHVAELDAIAAGANQAKAAGPAVVAKAAARPASEPAASSATASDGSIRVSVRLLDELMNLAGELVLSRNQLVQTVSSIRATGLDSVAGRLDQITSELQESIMQTRMQAVGTVFSKFPRVVRDLSKQLGKEIELTLEGEDVELDKSIIEAIGDPLTHLIRNSVDHGVELPEKRTQSGKPRGGTIVLRAFHQAGKVNISIRDDGAGIDPERLKEKAVSRGLITPELAGEMSDREAVRLIFLAGFSMTENVTEVSGRGVGMDVVKTNIEKLGGIVDIDTQLGAGTTINVKLPLTLAIIPSLIVRCGDDRFAIPQASISELVRVKASEAEKKIDRVKQAEVLRLRENLLPLVRLDHALDVSGESAAQDDGPINIIVVETGRMQYGLVVDGLHDSEEIVVKPLGRHLQECHCLAGATVLGDGRVALILDVVGIASQTELALPDEASLTQAGDALAAARDAETQPVLLFANHPDEHFGIPMAIITRLERVRADQIDSVGGKDVLQFRGASLPVLCLENYIMARSRSKTERIYVVVFTVADREVGLIVPTLTDIRRVPTDVDMVTFREPGVIGSVEVDGKVMRLLDLFKLTHVAMPELLTDSDAIESRAVWTQRQAAGLETAPKILLAEDSTFFRKQVTDNLEEAGYEVTGCEDGLIAWNTLQERGGEFDLVVTDVEMPNLNGCQLSRRIKDDPALAHLPVIALTSLASEEDIQRGMEAGIDDYQVKLDRERLMASVARFIQKTKPELVPAGELDAISMGSQS